MRMWKKALALLLALSATPANAAVTPNSLITPQVANRGLLQFTPSNTPGVYATLYIAGLNGSKCHAVWATNNDGSATHLLSLQVVSGAGAKFGFLGLTSVENAGFAAGTPAQNLLQQPIPLPLDSDGNPYLLLASGDILQATFTAAITSGDEINLEVACSDYSPVCPQAASLLGRMDGSENTQAVINLVCGMVADGSWGLMDAFYVFATNSQANAKLNWASTNFGLTLNGTCTFTPGQGYTGDGSSCYFSSSYIPSSNGINYTQNSASQGLCLLTNSAYTGGTTGGANSSLLAISASSATYNDLNDASFTMGPNAATAVGSWIGSRTNSSSTSLYQNGGLFSNFANVSTGVISANPYIGAGNASGSPSYLTAAQMGYFFFGGGLTSAQVSSLNSRLHAYMQAVGGAAC